jgi:DNA-binding response OmpR family regulator
MPIDVAFDGGEARERTAVTGDDVLDPDLPGLHGGDRGQSAVLMLTATGTVEARVEGLRIGVADHLPKPFHMLTPVDSRIGDR